MFQQPRRNSSSELKSIWQLMIMGITSLVCWDWKVSFAVNGTVYWLQDLWITCPHISTAMKASILLNIINLQSKDMTWTLLNTQPATQAFFKETFQTTPLADSYIYSNHLSIWQWIDPVRRNYCLITHNLGFLAHLCLYSWTSGLLNFFPKTSWT